MVIFSFGDFDGEVAGGGGKRAARSKSRGRREGEGVLGVGKGLEMG